MFTLALPTWDRTDFCFCLLLLSNPVRAQEVKVQSAADYEVFVPTNFNPQPVTEVNPAYQAVEPKTLPNDDHVYEPLDPKDTNTYVI